MMDKLNDAYWPRDEPFGGFHDKKIVQGIKTTKPPKTSKKWALNCVTLRTPLFDAKCFALSHINGVMGNFMLKFPLLTSNLLTNIFFCEVRRRLVPNFVKIGPLTICPLPPQTPDTGVTVYT